MSFEPLGTRPAVKLGMDCELDPNSYELRRPGRVLKMERIPAEILLLLLENRGQVVTRDQIAESIWGKNVSLDTDNSINGAIRKIRQVLKDDSDRPRFIQTITGRGYRFIAPAEPLEVPGPRSPQEDAAGRTPESVAAAVPAHPSAAVPSMPAETGEPDPAPALAAPPTKRRSGHWVMVSAALAVSLVILLAMWLARARSASRTRPATDRVVLAVLPFENLTGDPSQDYFSDGITEEMIAEIGSLNPQRLAVIGRTSVMGYKRNPKPLDQVGRALGVQYVLEGSVRREADKVRVSAQLVRVQDQTELWARQYDRELRDVLLLQSEIARDTSNGIQAALGEHAQIAAADQPPLTTEAYESYELYLKGQFFWNKRDGEALERAIDYFQQSIAKDPNNARAWAGLADSYALLGGYLGVQRPEYAVRAKAAALRALQVGPNLAETHTAFALITENYEWQWERAEEEYQRAIALNPSYATAHQWYAECLTWQGRFDEALRESDRARQLDPLSLIIASDRGAIFYYSRQYDRAIEEFLRVREMDPDFPRSGIIALAYAQKGMMQQALASMGPFSDASWSWAERAYLYGRAGRHAEAKNALNKLLEWRKREPVDIWFLAIAYIATGDKDQALAWLERAYQTQPNALTTLKVDPVYDPLRSDRRFQDLLRRVRLSE